MCIQHEIYKSIRDSVLVGGRNTRVLSTDEPTLPVPALPTLMADMSDELCFATVGMDSPIVPPMFDELDFAAVSDEPVESVGSPRRVVKLLVKRCGEDTTPSPPKRLRGTCDISDMLPSIAAPSDAMDFGFVSGGVVGPVCTENLGSDAHVPMALSSITVPTGATDFSFLECVSDVSQLACDAEDEWTHI